MAPLCDLGGGHEQNSRRVLACSRRAASHSSSVFLRTCCGLLVEAAANASSPCWQQACDTTSQQARPFTTWFLPEVCASVCTEQLWVSLVACKDFMFVSNLCGIALAMQGEFSRASAWDET